MQNIWCTTPVKESFNPQKGCNLQAESHWLKAKQSALYLDDRELSEGLIRPFLMQLKEGELVNLFKK